MGLLLAIVGCHSSPKPVIYWSRPQLTATALAQPWQLIDDPLPPGDIITIRLRAFLISLGQTEPLFATRVLGLRVPVYIAKGATVSALEHRLSGVIEGGEDGRIWMIAVVGDRVFWKSFARPHGSSKSLLWQFRAGLERPLHDEDQYTLQLFLVAQRESNQSPLTVAIDSIEICPAESVYAKQPPRDHFTDRQISDGSGVLPKAGPTTRKSLR